MVPAPGTGSSQRGVEASPRSHPVDLAAGDAIHHDAAQLHVHQALEPEDQALLLILYPSR